MNEYQDPGWKTAVGKWLTMHVPLPIQAASDPVDGISSLRVTFLAFIEAALVALVIAYLLATSGGESQTSAGLGVGVAAYGVGTLGLVFWAKSRPLVAINPEILAAAWRRNYIFGLVFAESAVALGFVLTLAGGNLFQFLTGLVFTLAGLRLMAPTKAELGRGQRQVHATGSDLSLGRALEMPPPPKGQRQGASPKSCVAIAAVSRSRMS